MIHNNESLIANSLSAIKCTHKACKSTLAEVMFMNASGKNSKKAALTL